VSNSQLRSIQDALVEATRPSRNAADVGGFVALLDGAGGPPKPAYVIRLQEAVPEEELLTAWKNPAADQKRKERGNQNHENAA